MTQENNDKQPIILFSNYTCQFISALKKKFKNDLDIQKTAQEFDNLFVNCKSLEIKNKLRDKMITNWYKTFHNLTDKLNKNDSSFIHDCNHELMNKLNLKERFLESSSKVQTTIMNYLKGINAQSELHFTAKNLQDSLPSSLMNKVLNASKSLKEKGKMDFASIYAVSEQIANTMNEDETNSIESFANPQQLKKLLGMVKGFK